MYLISFYKKIFLVYLNIIALPAIIFSQNKTIDSLNEIVKTAGDSVKSLALIELASNYSGYDTIKCDRSLQGAAAILSSKSWKYNLAYYYQANSDIQSTRGKYEMSLVFDDSAIFFYKTAIQSNNLNTRKEAKFQMAVVTADKGSTYSTLGKNDEAMRYYLEALKLYEQSDNPEKNTKIGTCYNNIATVYYILGDYNKGLEYDVKAIPFHLQGGDNESISFAYIFAASDFSMIKQLDSAKAYFLKASPYVTALNKPSVNVEYYGKTGMLFWTIKDWPNAIKYYKIDTSIQELRRVAYNMMPEALVKFGLDEALKDYCSNINNPQILNVQYQSFGLIQRIDSSTEIIIYRIIQELLNNIFKHAKASEVLVQLLRSEENRLSITVEDNGKGFDINELAKSKGAGWANIRSRIDYLKGKLDIHSDAQKGTSVNIEINV